MESGEWRVKSEEWSTEEFRNRYVPDDLVGFLNDCAETDKVLNVWV